MDDNSAFIEGARTGAPVGTKPRRSPFSLFSNILTDLGLTQVRVAASGAP